MQKRAFTLIELLVVIAIIGLLSAVVLSSLNAARMKGRDARRISDLEQIRSALELYYDANGQYPPSPCGYDCNGYAVSYDPVSWGALRTALAPYIKLPDDPLNSGGCYPWTYTGCYTYSYGNVGKTTYKPQYDLTAQLEDPNSPQRCAVRHYKYYFDNQYDWCGSYSPQLFEISN